MRVPSLHTFRAPLEGLARLAHSDGALAFLLGGAAALSMAPFGITPLLFLGLSGLYVLLARAGSWRAAGALGFSFGFGYFLLGLYWIGNALLVEGNPYWWAWPLAAAGVPLLLSAFPAFACISTRWARLERVSGALFFVGAMALAEWLRGHVATGLPWNLYGYAWAPALPVVQSVSVIGIYGLTLATLFVSVIPGFFWVAGWRRAWPLAVVGAALFGGIYAWGAARLAAHPVEYDRGVRVRIVQPNVDQATKWDPALTAQYFRRRIMLSYPEFGQERAAQTYVIWPETALHRDVLDDPAAARAIGAMLRAHGGRAYLLAGMVEEDGRYYNSLALIDEKARVLQRYDKAHLVPFGEYVPLADWLGFLGPVSAFAAFTAGPGPGALAAPGGPRFAAQICYESVFPGTVMSDTQAIVNVTNDAWYGASPGPYQHLTHARFRAVEEGRPLLRATGTGISAVVDPMGRVLERLPLFAQGAITTWIPKPVAQPGESLPAPWGSETLRKVLFFIVIMLFCAPAIAATIRDK